MLKFHGKAVYDVFNEVEFSVASFSYGQFYGLGEFLMGFAKMCFECDTRFLGWRKAISGLVGLSEFPSPVDNIIGL